MLQLSHASLHSDEREALAATAAFLNVVSIHYRMALPSDNRERQGLGPDFSRQRGWLLWKSFGIVSRWRGEKLLLTSFCAMPESSTSVAASAILPMSRLPAALLWALSPRRAPVWIAIRAGRSAICKGAGWLLA